MRRAPPSIIATALVSALASTLALAAGCDPSPPPSSGTSTTTAATATATDVPAGGPSPSGLSPLSPQALADRPMPAAPAAAQEPDTIAAQHLLVAYKGASGAAKTIKRS